MIKGKFFIHFLFVFSSLFFSGRIYSQACSVEIMQDSHGWKMAVNGEPFYIKGVVGHEFLEVAKEYGANSVRIGSRKAELDKLDRFSMKALVNLPAKAERNGMNYSDTTQVRIQKEKILSIVRELKDHPAVLMWAIGNELDFIPPLEPFNPAVWDAVNDIAKEIHAIDPHHPVMTVIGTSKMEKVEDIAKKCIDLDLLGVNTYGDIYSLKETLQKFGWRKPYVITEWGPDGYWEVKKSAWGAPFEQTGREKLNCYFKKYTEGILNVKDQCLGSYVFYWAGFKQETTHTWFCLFDKEGNRSPMVELMGNVWRGNFNLPQVSIVDSVGIFQKEGSSVSTLILGEIYKAKAFCTLEAGKKHRYFWEIRPEAIYASYAGQGEQVPQPIAGLIQEMDSAIHFQAPDKEGAYRLFVYIYNGTGNFSTSNISFYVKTMAE